jgi:hypothetical protein
LAILKFSITNAVGVLFMCYAVAATAATAAPFSCVLNNLFVAKHLQNDGILQLPPPPPILHSIHSSVRSRAVTGLTRKAGDFLFFWNGYDLAATGIAWGRRNAVLRTVSANLLDFPFARLA